MKWSVTIKGNRDVRLRGTGGRFLSWPRTIVVNGPKTKEDAEAAALSAIGMDEVDAETCHALLVTKPGEA